MKQPSNLSLDHLLLALPHEEFHKPVSKPVARPPFAAKMRSSAFKNLSLASCVLLAASIWIVGCTTPASNPNPLEGWKGGTSAYVGCPFDKAISDDYRDYIQTLPHDEQSYVRDSNVRFFEDGTGQHAVEISIPLDGTWWKHVLIYGKDDRRTKVIKYTSGRYAS